MEGKKARERDREQRKAKKERKEGRTNASVCVVDV